MIPEGKDGETHINIFGFLISLMTYVKNYFNCIFHFKTWSTWYGRDIEIKLNKLYINISLNHPNEWYSFRRYWDLYYKEETKSFYIACPLFDICMELED